MFRVSLSRSGESRTVKAGRGERLLDVIRRAGLDMVAPCGGNGTCGKCRVLVRGEGYMLSCVYTVQSDLELTLPEEREAEILASQYLYNLSLPCDPGPAASLSAWPMGMAVDLGTTTLVCSFMNLITGMPAGTFAMLNPQQKYGADVISRISYCIREKKGLRVLRKEITDLLNSTIRRFVSQNSANMEDIVKITVAGNNTMLHLLLGTDPSGIARAPFTPVFTEQKNLRASAAGLECHPEAILKVLPSVSAYVGADIVAGLASLQLPEGLNNFLFVDIGTNGETALVTPGRIWCCSAAAGPAFEGANIQCGMGAVEGAISAYTGGKVSTIGNAPPAGICGSGLLDVVAWLLDRGIVSEDGCMEKDYILVEANETAAGQAIFVTPQDIREIQLAKAAMAAGMNILLQVAGMEAGQLDAVFLAGGFGNYLDTGNAVRIGLLPPVAKHKIIQVGNTCESGALLSLRSERFDERIQQLLKRTSYIELSTEENFAGEFAMNMEFTGRR